MPTFGRNASVDPAEGSARMQRSRLVPPLPGTRREVPTSGPCPACGRPDALHTTRVESGRRVSCRHAERGDGSCSWPGVERPFRRPTSDAMPAPFVERLARIAERVVEECVERGAATARIDPQYAESMRAAIRRVARDRDLQVRTNHVGDGRIEVRTI